MIGNHLIVDMVRVEKSVLESPNAWIDAFEKVAEFYGFKIVGKNHHKFLHPSKLGFTAFIMFDTSHFSIHTFSEMQIAALDLFVCKDIDLIDVLKMILDELHITEQSVKTKYIFSRFEE